MTNPGTRRKSKLCPICNKRFRYRSIAAHGAFPFCSARCKTIDLGSWIDGRYAFVEDLTREHDLAAGGIDAMDDPEA